MYPGPYAMPAPYQSVSSQVRPSKLWFLLAGGVALVAIVAGFVVIGVAAAGYVNEIDQLHRIDAPGSGHVELSRAGGYSIYYELPGQAFGRDDPPVLRPAVTVTGPDGQNVPLKRYHATVRYNQNGRSGIGVYTFRADRPGSYTVASSSAGLESGASLAVGHSIGRGLVTGVVAGLLFMAVGVVAGIIIAIIIGVRRTRSRRLLNEGRAQWPYGGGPPPGWPSPAMPGYAYPGPPPPPGGGYPPAGVGAPPSAPSGGGYPPAGGSGGSGGTSWPGGGYPQPGTGAPPPPRPSPPPGAPVDPTPPWPRPEGDR